MRMASVFSKFSLRWILSCIIGLSLVSFTLISLYELSQQSSVKREGKVLVSERGRILINDIPSTHTQMKQVNEALTMNENVRKNSFPKNHSKQFVVDTTVTNQTFAISLKNSSLSFNVHIFYYPWYQNEKTDGKYSHWNHEQIPDWHKPSEKQHRRRSYVPPGDIGANFYPKMGPYSSHDPNVIETHMQQMKFMGTGVVCVSWYPPNHVKIHETQVDDLMTTLFDIAAKYGIKITFHIEPYDNRSGKTLLEVSKYIIDKYGNHTAFYRTSHKGRKLPVYYVYDSYQIAPASWAEALKPNGQYSVRNTKYDAIFLGLLVERSHLVHLSDSGFDGFYTYFAINGFSYGSSWINWSAIAAESEKRKLIFAPSIGPGYLDTRVRPWNNGNTRLRLNGKYYRKSFHNAMSLKPHFLSITSFNEWHEGTQVEPAIPKVHKDFKYVDYSPNSPEFYLNMTRQFVHEYTKNMSKIFHAHDREAF